ncbi:hypothetical protein [Candidatus Liberibacter brunswickensis]|uniref:hypothetical protein n=1 Tax=Candidatus Liberibacter brunswickensis TaxID=1968796 RepID=UPI002FE4250C
MIISEINNNNKLSFIKKEGNIKNDIQKREAVTDINTVNNAPTQSKSFFEKALEGTKETAISMIPVYGTIREFKKGNYGWGALSLVTDVAMLLPFVGYGSKIAMGLVRGGNAAAKIGEASIVAAKEAAIITKEGSNIVHTIEGSASAIKNQSTVIETSFHVLPDKKTLEETFQVSLRNTENAKLVSSPNIAANSARNTEEAGGKIFNNILANGMENIEHSQKSLTGLISKSKKTFELVSLNKNNELKKVGTSHYYDFRLLGEGKVYKNFKDASKATTFTVNGQKIATGNSENMLKALNKMFPENFKTVQLISSFAHENIFKKPFTKNFFNLKHAESYQLANPKYHYSFNVINDNKIAFSMKDIGDIVVKNSSVKGEYNNYMIRADGFIYKDKPAVLAFSYNVN